MNSFQTLSNSFYFADQLGARLARYHAIDGLSNAEIKEKSNSITDLAIEKYGYRWVGRGETKAQLKSRLLEISRNSYKLAMAQNGWH